MLNLIDAIFVNVRIFKICKLQSLLILNTNVYKVFDYSVHSVFNEAIYVCSIHSYYVTVVTMLDCLLVMMILLLSWNSCHWIRPLQLQPSQKKNQRQQTLPAR